MINSQRYMVLNPKDGSVSSIKLNLLFDILKSNYDTNYCTNNTTFSIVLKYSS